MPVAESPELSAACRTVTELLLNERNAAGWWEGQLSTSALSTATAVMALSLAEKAGDDSQQTNFELLIERGLQWLEQHQNDDGGWGDTVLSISNISTTMLANAVFHATGTVAQYSGVVDASQKYIDRAGGVDAVIRRYGKDHTFSVPILTHCALAGRIDWKRVMPLPFELSCVPAKFYAAVKMPVVSYALPALIAIGQAIFKHRGHWNPIVRMIRKAAIKPSLKVLESLQPEHGGFLEATPLTSFVCMSLLGCGYHDHPVTKRCLQFITASVRSDGSWPIDTNLATWVTTLSVNALAGDTTSAAVDDVQQRIDRDTIRNWLLQQQYKVVHPYTNSPPGGWSWTDLPGGVPDADDTPGAMLAVMNLRLAGEEFSEAEKSALENAAVWLLNLQNRDGGWPTFCRGWGTLPFDRSSNDLTAHVLRALAAWQGRVTQISASHSARAETAIRRGLNFLQKTQAADGSWLPLWFGHQFNADDENPLYGTAKVVLALKETGQLARPFAQRGIHWLLKNQNDDGGWSAKKGLSSSVEETGLAVEALANLENAECAVKSGADWLIGRVNAGNVTEPSPIGFYFAKLWYFERLYPTIFAAAALRRCVQAKQRECLVADR
ncbi:MAG: prenyltransferase/squalene oxidase repeat-containing protein [Planctomycetaceae bacterium]